MKKSVPFAGLLVLLLAVPAFAEEVYVVHGIDGSDLGLPSSLPVDISVNGGCAIEDFTYGDITPAIDLDPGKYEIMVYVDPAGSSSCAGILAITGRVDIAFSENASIVAHLTEEGTPTLTKFTNDIRDTDQAGNARVVARHTAAAPAVQLNVTQGATQASLDLANPGEAGAELAARGVTIEIPGVVGPLSGGLAGDTAYFVYAVGSLKNGTFNFLLQTISINN